MRRGAIPWLHRCSRLISVSHLRGLKGLGSGFEPPVFLEKYREKGRLKGMRKAVLCTRQAVRLEGNCRFGDCGVGGVLG